MAFGTESRSSLIPGCMLLIERDPSTSIFRSSLEVADRAGLCEVSLDPKTAKDRLATKLESIVKALREMR